MGHEPISGLDQAEHDLELWFLNFS
jgi:hypothetical protein